MREAFTSKHVRAVPSSRPATGRHQLWTRGGHEYQPTNRHNGARYYPGARKRSGDEVTEIEWHDQAMRVSGVKLWLYGPSGGLIAEPRGLLEAWTVDFRGTVPREVDHIEAMGLGDCEQAS